MLRMKTLENNQSARVKNVLKIVKEYVANDKLIEARWLLKKIEKFVGNTLMSEFKQNILSLRDMIKLRSNE